MSSYGFGDLTLISLSIDLDAKLCPVLYCQITVLVSIVFLKTFCTQEENGAILFQTSLFSSKLHSSNSLFMLVSLLILWFVIHLLRGDAQPAVDPADHPRFLKQAAEQNSCFGGPASGTSANTSQTKLFRFFFSCTCPYIESQLMCTWCGDWDLHPGYPHNVIPASSIQRFLNGHQLWPYGYIV